MKNIVIISFLYENSDYIRMFEILRDHYLRMIDEFSFPIKYYGCRVGSETIIDDDNHMIWLEDRGNDYDKKLTFKVRDAFKVVDDNMNYDLIIKTNASTLLNLVYVNRFLQRAHPDVCWCAQMWNPGWPVGASTILRGNILVLPKDPVKDVIREFSNEEEFEARFIKRVFTDQAPSFMKEVDPYIIDDWYISLILCDHNRWLGCISPDGCNLSVIDYIKVNTDRIPDSVEDILYAPGITIKTYYDQNMKGRPTETSEPDLFCLDVILLKLFVGVMEKNYLYLTP